MVSRWSSIAGPHSRAGWLALALLLCLPALLRADRFDDGKERYKAGDYAGAAALFQEHLRDNARDANAWYNLGLADYKLKRYRESVDAFRRAGQLDPAIGFTSPAKYREKLAAAEEKAGVGPEGAAGGGSPADYKDAKARYDAGDYAGAADGFSRYVKANPDDARAWYNLGLSYAKLKRYDGALDAYSHAESADPAIGFTRKAKFEEKVAEARRKAGMAERAGGGAADRAGGGATQGSGSDEPTLSDVEVRALQQKNVLVEPAAASRLPVSEEAMLERFAVAGEPHLKILVLANEPHDGRAAFTLALHRYLALGDTALIVVSPKGVSAQSEALSESEMQRLTDDSARFFAMSWRQGIEHLGGAIREHERAEAASGRNLLIGALAFVALFFWWGARVRRRELQKLLAEANERTANLVPKLQDAEVDARLSQDPRVKEFYAQASQRFVEASAVLENVATRADARRVIALATESERLLGYAANPDSAPTQRPERMADGGDVTACFFCSRPASEGVLRPASVSVEGEKRRVLACKSCSQELHEGRMPRLRVVRDGDEEVPWFRSSSYNARRDWMRDDYNSRDVVVYHHVLRDYDTSRPAIVYVDDDRLVDRRMEAASAASIERDRSASSDFSPSSRGGRSASTDFLTSDHS